MVLDGVDVFVRVVEAGGFSAAARLMGMPVTTVSAKIARLEERLGVTLIQRSTRKMHVTAAGEAYYAHCAEAMRALEAGEAQLEEASAEPGGLLRLTAAPDVAQALLPGLIARYLKAYPRVSVDLVITNRQVDLVAEGVDIALRAGPQLKDSTLQSRVFGDAGMRLFASPDYLKTRGAPQTPDELDGHEVMLHTRFPEPFRVLSDGKTSFPLPPPGRMQADDIETIRAFTLRGLCIALLPDFPGGQAGLVPVLPEFRSQPGNIYFVFPGGRFTPVNVRAFIDLAVEGMKGGSQR